MNRARLLLALVAALCVLVPAASRLPAESRALLSPRQADRHRHEAELPSFTLARLPDDAVVLEDGRALPRPRAPLAAIAAIGSGRFAIEGGARVHLSSRDGTSPATNGRRYEVVFTPNVIGSRPVLGLVALTVLFAAVLVLTGRLDLSRAWPTRERLALALATSVLLGIGFARRFDEAKVQPDSSSYLLRLSSRPVLYPLFLDLVDARTRAEREPVAARADALCQPEGGYYVLDDGPLRRVAAVQRTATILAIAVLAFVLAGSLNGWLVAALVYLGVLVDGLRGSDASVAFNVSVIQSEGLNHPLVFLYLAAVLAYLRTPSVSRGLALAAVLALLLLNRPANGPLASALGLVFLFHVGRDGWRRALLVTAGLGAATALPLGVEAARLHARTGFWKLHAYTGWSLIGMPLQVAVPEDAQAFDEPDLREFVRRCTVDLRARKIDDAFACPTGEYVGNNIFQIAMPAAAALAVPGDRPDLAAWVQDEKVGRVARTLIARHKGAYLALVLDHLQRLLSWKWHGGALVVFAAGLVLLRRQRTPEVFFLLLVAALPFVAIAPACLVNYPAERYRSQLYFAEVLAGPLLAAILASSGWYRSRPCAESSG